jgi:Na+/proline symporter
MFYTDWQHRHFMIKDFLAGIFIAIVMTGLDQDMMQKSLSCRNLKEARKNIYWLSFALVPVNLLFLSLGAVLWIFAANTQGFPEIGTTDQLFPTIAFGYLGPVAGITFIIGLIAAAYSSADSALTALTTSFSVDILGLRKRDDLDDKKKTAIRYRVHLGISLAVLLVIIIFDSINDRSVISSLFTIAGYTYGPLLGMFSFGLFTKLKVKDSYVPFIAIISPAICYVFSVFDQQLFWGYDLGFELLLLNGFLTFTGLYAVHKK